MRILLFELNSALKSLPSVFTNTQISFRDMKKMFKNKFHQGAPTVTCVGGFSSVAFSRQKVQEAIFKVPPSHYPHNFAAPLQNFAHVNYLAGYTGYYKISMLFYLHRPPHPL